MRCVARMVVVCGVLAGGVTCMALPDRPPQKAQTTLSEESRAVLFPALQAFFASPGTTPDPRFVTVRNRRGTLHFAAVPKGWEQTPVADGECQEIWLKQDGFSLTISINDVPDLDVAVAKHVQEGRHDFLILLDHRFLADSTQVPRVVIDRAFKGGTAYIEYRYFKAKEGAACVELSVFHSPQDERTLNHLLAHLRAHYGKYEGVCQQVGQLVSARR